MMPFPLALSLDLFGLLRLRRWSCPSGIGRDAGAESTASEDSFLFHAV